MKLSALIFSIWLTSLFNSSYSQSHTIKLEEIARGFVSPVGMVSPNDGTNRLFVFEQSGKIKIVKEGKLLPNPFINISSKLDGLNIAYSEKGLLGMAFHPDYKSNGRFFIYYSAPYKHLTLDHKSIISEFKVSDLNPDKAMLEEHVIMEIYQPESNHNGGMLAFGPDGYLYIGTGDGGGAGDEHGDHGNSQDLKSLLGKILRIDVDRRKPYAIPYDNPFVGVQGARAEIWSYGLRNPWRFSFDKVTKELYCGDVGQNKYEEINIIKKGANYGWRIMEGMHCFNPPEDCDQTNLELPINEYDHSEGISVCGGYIYRGKKNNSIYGNYIFGDWSGKLFILEPGNENKWKRSKLFISETKDNDIDGKINSMGEDANGELYLLTQKLFGPKSPTGVLYILKE